MPGSVHRPLCEFSQFTQQPSTLAAVHPLSSNMDAQGLRDEVISSTWQLVGGGVEIGIETIGPQSLYLKRCATWMKPSTVGRPSSCHTCQMSARVCVLGVQARAAVRAGFTAAQPMRAHRAPRWHGPCWLHTCCRCLTVCSTVSTKGLFIFILR